MTTEPRRRSTLRGRLLLAFVGVAAAAIAVFAALTLWAGRGDVDRLVQRQQKATAANVAAAAADGYASAGGWSLPALRATHLIALGSGAVVEVRDASAGVVTQVGRGARMGMGGGQRSAVSTAFGDPIVVPVVVGGRVVGSVAVRFPKSALPPAEQQLRDALTRTTILGALIAAGVALVVGVAVANGITRPLARLTESVRAFGGGDRSARADVSAPGEIGELATAFDAMADDLEREDRLRRMLTADVAHELRTPVTILTAQCEAMVDGVVEPSRDQLASLHDESVRLSRVIEDLETLAAAEAAGLRLEVAPVDVAEVVRATAAALAGQYAAASVELVTSLEPAVVEGDAFRLAQVVRNLLVNALKYTPSGGRVDVAVTREEDAVAVAVADTGIGIAAEDVPHVFDRFWRGANGRAASGSGVGLAVVDRLVRAHRGSIEVESEPGRGTVFTVHLPELPAGAGVPAS